MKYVTNYTQVEFLKPPEDVFVWTKIDDGKTSRNHQKLKRKGNLYFCEDGTYVYYTPTHWKHIEQYCSYDDKYNNW